MQLKRPAAWMALVTVMIFLTLGQAYGEPRYDLHGDLVHPGAEEFAGVFDGIGAAPQAIARLCAEPHLRLSLVDFSETYPEREPALAVCNAAGEPPAPAAFVNIMQGCDNFCAYCIVPFVRGRQKSRRPEAVLDECRALLAAGAREITLLGQNVNSYGLDGAGDARADGAGGEGGFADLLYAAAGLPGLERLRFVTPHPKDIAPRVIEAFADLPALCPRLHLPLQSGSDRILKAMNRRYDTARYLDIVRRLKQARPDIVLTTDIIVGFPGESEADFQATMDLMREVGFASSFSFVYSDRPGAKAVLLPGKVERAVALERLSRLQEWQNQASVKVLEGMAGKTVEVLIEGRSRWDSLLDETSGPEAFRAGAAPCTAEQDGAWQGKTPQGFIVNVPLAPRPDGAGWEGAMVPAFIEAAARHSLKGRQAGAPW